MDKIQAEFFVFRSIADLRYYLLHVEILVLWVPEVELIRGQYSHLTGPVEFGLCFSWPANCTVTAYANAIKLGLNAVLEGKGE
jgi:hypothetical protein